jgi:cell division protein FtsB
MQNFLKKWAIALRGIKVNKYHLTILIFLVVTFFIGDSTILKRYSYDQEINRLEKEIEQNKKMREENIRKKEALKYDNESLEKFAREQYLMTKPDEDLFIIIP